MTDLVVLGARIRDRISMEWLTPSQRRVWVALQSFEGPPHRVVNVFGQDGAGKTFLGWLMDRQKYAAYAEWSLAPVTPSMPRLVLDNAPSDRQHAREARSLIESHGIQQVILLTRARIDELALPTLEMQVNQDDVAHFRSNLYRHLGIAIPDDYARNYAEALALLNP